MNSIINDIRISGDISVEEFLEIRAAVHFQPLNEEQARLVLDHTSHIAVARHKGTCVGITRLLFDYGIDAYISDVAVHPDYQGMGIGKMLLTDILSYIRKNGVPGTVVACSLYANKGKEGFYRNLGFEELPNTAYGHGMLLEIKDHK